MALNKMDVAGEAGRAAARRLGAVAISAMRGEGLGELMRAVLETLDLGGVGADEVFAFSRRQRELLEQLAMAGEVGQARELLAELIGGEAGAETRGQGDKVTG